MTNNLDISTKKQSQQRIYVVCGIIMPIFFTILVIVESLLRPGYSQIQMEISILGTGSYSIIQNMNFIISGLLSIGFALGFGAALSARRAGQAAKWMVIVFGVGLIFAGVFLILSIIIFGENPTDYIFYYAHTVASLIAFLTIIAAQLLTWQALKKGNHMKWGHYPTYSLLSGLLSIAMFGVFFLTFNSPYSGLGERLFAAVSLIWIEVTGWKLYSLIKKG